MIEQVLYSVLSGSPAITATADTRVYPLVLPGNPTLPALTYQMIATVSEPTFNTAGGQRARVQIDCWALNFGDAVSLRSAVVETLNGYSDANFTAQLLNQTDYFEHEALQYRCLIEFYIYFTAL